MKKTNYIILFILIISNNLIPAQEEKVSKFNFMASGGIGYGLVENDNEPKYNLNSNSLELLINYKIGQIFGIATGIGTYQLSGNGFNSVGNFYHERRVLKIPLVATLNKNITQNISLLANLGVFTQNITRDEYRYLTHSQNDIFDGWNFGAQFGIGFTYKVTKNFSLGLNYAEHYEINKFKSNNNKGINDKQIVNNRNSIGLLFLFEI